MADRTKGSYRGKTYTRKSRRTGKKTVRVRGYCRRRVKGILERIAYDRNMPF